MTPFSALHQLRRFHFFDKWFIKAGVDPSTGNSAVYVAYTCLIGGAHIVVLGSNNGGVSYTTPLTIGTAAAFDLYASPAVGPDGELYVSWFDAAATFNTNKIWFNRDLDGLWATTHTFGTDSSIRNLVNGSLFKYLVPAQPERGIHTALL